MMASFKCAGPSVNEAWIASPSMLVPNSDFQRVNSPENDALLKDAVIIRSAVRHGMIHVVALSRSRSCGGHGVSLRPGKHGMLELTKVTALCCAAGVGLDSSFCRLRRAPALLCKAR
jgi:hypothetical protein